MSVQFGRWNFESQPPAPDYIERVSAALAPYGPDSNESYSKGGVSILYRAFHTTKESHRETQPHVSASGAVITWDGRLDNRAELINDIRGVLSTDSTDLAIVSTAYECWGNRCFARLVGDWALSIWNPANRAVVLAKDPIGTRQLYYSFDQDKVTWSTILEPLVSFAGRSLSISEEYIAGWLSSFPAAHLSPYVGIHSVPPSCFVRLEAGRQVVNKYWDFDPTKRIRYDADIQYEEHFRSVFAQAVQRRLRSDRPVLAELSGGMDSSSIVCMADMVIGRDEAETPRLDTISWYDERYDHIEPDWNERPYFTKVENKRGRAGYQIDAGALTLRKAQSDTQAVLRGEVNADRLMATPCSDCRLPELFHRYAAYMQSQGHRVILSGIGGDEITGSGVPTPTLELQDLLTRAHLLTLVRQLNAWGKKMRRRRLSLLWEAVREVFPLTRAGLLDELRFYSCFNSGFVRRNRSALSGYPIRIRLFGPLPSFQDSLAKLEADRRLLAHCYLRPDLLRDARYPYLDRDFLEFMFAIPREQIVRVGQRRSLMKRALVNIVPTELLNRRRKAFVPPDAATDRLLGARGWLEADKFIFSSSLGIIDTKRFAEVARDSEHRQITSRVLKRALTLEAWLRHLAMRRVVAESPSTQKANHFLPRDVKKQARTSSAS